MRHAMCANIGGGASGKAQGICCGDAPGGVLVRDPQGMLNLVTGKAWLPVVGDHTRQRDPAEKCLVDAAGAADPYPSQDGQGGGAAALELPTPFWTTMTHLI